MVQSLVSLTRGTAAVHDALRTYNNTLCTESRSLLTMRHGMWAQQEGRVMCDRVPTWNVSTATTASEALPHAGHKSEGPSMRLPGADGMRERGQGGPRGAGAVWAPDVLLLGPHVDNFQDKIK